MYQLFMISYDLNKDQKNYEGLAKSIDDLSGGRWCKPCKSTWIVACNYNKSSDLFGVLKQSVDADDFLVVAKMTGDVAVQSTKDVEKYITENIHPTIT